MDDEARRARDREYKRRWREANPEKDREAKRRYDQSARGRARNAEAARRWRAENPEKHLEGLRAWRAANPEYRARKDREKAHGPDIHEAVDAMWLAQEGRCYLCRKQLEPGRRTHIDHDHTCCGPRRSCARCRRGLACDNCNVVLSRVNDDPDLLRKIADNFAPVLASTRARIALEPVQPALPVTNQPVSP
jgi:hypothetical protein